MFAFLFVPSNLMITFWTFGLLALALWPNDKRVRIPFFLVSGSLVLLFWGPISHLVARPLETRFAQYTPQATETTRYIVHLGGAERPGMMRHRKDMRLNDQVGRYLEVMRVARLHPDTTILYSGGYHTENGSDLEIAAAAYDAAGLKDRTIFLGGAEDTCANAREVAAYLKASGESHSVVLVTSAMHMARAVLCFQAHSVNPVPAPAAPIGTAKLSFSGWLSAPLDARRLRHFDLAMHEWIGLVSYRLAGRIDRLWPSAT